MHFNVSFDARALSMETICRTLSESVLCTPCAQNTARSSSARTMVSVCSANGLNLWIKALMKCLVDTRVIARAIAVMKRRITLSNAALLRSNRMVAEVILRWRQPSRLLLKCWIRASRMSYWRSDRKVRVSLFDELYWRRIFRTRQRNNFMCIPSV